MDPYPLGGEIRSNGAPILGVKDALSIFSSENIPDSEFMVSGRIRALRKHGGVLFVTLIEEGKTCRLSWNAAWWASAH